MIQIKTEHQASELLREAVRASSNERRDTSVSAAIGRMYYIGIQWVQQGEAPGGYSHVFRSGVAAAGPQRIRATINEIAGNIIRITAATNPEKLYVDALPLHSVTGVIGSKNADLIEPFSNMMIDKSGLLRAAKRANFERSIDGKHGVGFRIQSQIINGHKNETIKAFSFDGSRLTLDPTSTSDDIQDGEFVMYSDVMSIHAIRRVYGDEALRGIDETKMSSIGQLTPTEQQFYQLSGGRMYSEYYRSSREKGALVHAVYLKGPSERFDRQLIMISAGGKNPDKVLNINNQENPIGLNGIPFITINGFRRPMSRAMVPDVALMKDTQDKLNMTASLFFQQMFDYNTNKTWFIDQSWFGGNRADKSEIIDEFNSGYVFGDARGRRGSPPVQVQSPPPSQALENTMNTMISQVKDASFQSALHQGKTKSNVTDLATQMSVDLTERPLDDRVKDDVWSYQRLISTMTATAIGLVKSGSPEIVTAMSDQGFSDEMIGDIAGMSQYRMPNELRLRDQALRPRSRQQRINQVERGIELGAVPPTEYSALMASLDTPINQLDKETIRYSRSVASRLLDGGQFEPKQLGSRVQIMLDELQRASMDPIALSNPEISQTIEEAKIDQMEIDGLLESEDEQPIEGDGAPEEMDLQTLLGGVSNLPA